MKKFVSLAMTAVMTASIVASASACTGFYVGKDVSANGTYVFGHTVDSSNANQGAVRAYPRVEEAGRVFNPTIGYPWENEEIVFPLPEVTYAYTTTPFVGDPESYDGSVINEMGVGVSGAVTCYITDEISAMDPCTQWGVGLGEAFLCKLVGMCAATAREGVEVLGKYIEMYGNAEQNTIVIADQNEAWYVEYYTGHQWCAVKLPDDCVAVYGNESMLHTVDPTSEDVICSEGLFSMPAEAGLAVYDENGNMDLYLTYSGVDTLADYSNRRTWYGHKMLAPSTAGEYNTTTFYDLCYKPDDVVTLDDVFEVTRARFEGTEWCPEENKEIDGMRVIAVERQTNTGAVEIYPNLPAAMAGVTWVCNGASEHNVFLPVSSLVTDMADRYAYTEGNGGVDENLAHYCFKRLAALAEQDRELYGTGVRAYWKTVETDLTANYGDVLKTVADLYAMDPAVAAEYITYWTMDLQNTTVDTANKIFDELMWYVIINTNTQTPRANKKPFVPSMMPAAN